ncbi:Carotenoid cleavage dioxygenase 7, chloroplastic [Glycine soja]
MFYALLVALDRLCLLSSANLSVLKALGLLSTQRLAQRECLAEREKCTCIEIHMLSPQDLQKKRRAYGGRLKKDMSGTETFFYEESLRVQSLSAARENKATTKLRKKKEDNGVSDNRFKLHNRREALRLERKNDVQDIGIEESLSEFALPMGFDCTGGRYLIRQSEILEFDFSRDALLATINEIAASIFFGKGPMEALKFFNVLQPFLMESLFVEGFSVSLEEFKISRAIKRIIRRSIGKASSLLYQLRSLYNELVAQQLEKHIQDVELPIINFALKSTKLGDLIDSKSKSTIDKVVQQIYINSILLCDLCSLYSLSLPKPGSMAAVYGMSPMILALMVNPSKSTSPIYLIPRFPGKNNGKERDWRVPVEAPSQLWLLHVGNAFEVRHPHGNLDIQIQAAACSYQWFNFSKLFAVILTEFQIKDLGNAFVMLSRYLDIRNYFVLGLFLSLLRSGPLPVSTLSCYPNLPSACLYFILGLQHHFVISQENKVTNIWQVVHKI